jgi:hypothetical protein
MQYVLKLLFTVRLFASSNFGFPLFLGVIGDDSWCALTGIHISADYFIFNLHHSASLGLCFLNSNAKLACEENSAFIGDLFW